MAEKVEKNLDKPKIYGQKGIDMGNVILAEGEKVWKKK